MMRIEPAYVFELSARHDTQMDCVFIVPMEYAVDAQRLLTDADYDYWAEDVVNQPYEEFFSSRMKKAGIPFKMFLPNGGAE